MAISNYGELKDALSVYMDHTEFLPQYDNATLNFEAAANRRLRVLPMETSTTLTTVSGDVALPTDYLAWRTVLWTGATPYVDLDYVHPAYLTSTSSSNDSHSAVFTIEGNTFKVRPADDTADIFEFHYYQKIPTIIGSNTDTNWLLTAWHDAYLYGVLTELMALGRNREGAELYKARRDETFAEIIKLYSLTTGASSPTVRVSEYF